MQARDPASWPVLEIQVKSGTLGFHGVIDRIDLDAKGRAPRIRLQERLEQGYETLSVDPVAAGRHIQLALYSRAVRDNVPDVEQVTSAFWFISTRGGFKRQSMMDDRPRSTLAWRKSSTSSPAGLGGGAFPNPRSVGTGIISPTALIVTYYETIISTHLIPGRREARCVLDARARLRTHHSLRVRPIVYIIFSLRFRAGAKFRLT